MKSKQFVAVAILAGGALVIYAGVSGYRIDDALRVIAGKEPKQAPRSWFGVHKGLALPGSKTGAAPLGYEWKGGYLESLDTSKFPAIDHGDSRYKVTTGGQRNIRLNGFDYYDPSNNPNYVPPAQGEGRNPDGSISYQPNATAGPGAVNI